MSWIVANGHVLGQCAYLRSLDEPWSPEETCDCADLLEDDPIWGDEIDPSVRDAVAEFADLVAEARVLADRPCETCGKPCEYPPQCRECSADEEAAAKRRADR